MTQPQKAVRVFISSTFRDMHGERDHLVTVVFPMLRERLERLDLDFFDVDLRWGVPQTGVDGEQANSWEYCRQWIDRVEPFFVSLLGQRYGWMPEPEAICDEAERQTYRGLSITEMEIRHAVLGARLRRQSHFYFRSTRVAEDAPPDVYREYVDVAEPARRLETLKASIEASGQVIRHYGCLWTGHNFTGFEAFGRMVFDDLWSGVLREERFVPKSVWRKALGHEPDTDELYTSRAVPIPEEVWERLVVLARPTPAHPLDQERGRMADFAVSRLKWFHGRKREIDRLDRFVSQDLPDGAARLCVVRARPGQGKSALLARFADTLAKSPHWVLTHFVGATERSADPHDLVDRLNQELDRSDLEWPSNEDAGPDLRRRLASRLAQYAGERRIVLLIDAVNQLTSGLDLEWLPSTLGPGVRVVLSCIEDTGRPEASAERRVMSALRSRVPEPEWIDLRPLVESDVRSVVTEYLLEYCKQLDRAQIDIICNLEQARNPLYLLVMLSELRTLGGNDMHRIVPTLIANLRQERPDNVSLFEWVLERLEVFGVDAVRLFCAYLALGRIGMSSRELRDLVASQLDDQGARAALRIERALRRYLLRRGPYLDFFHGEMRHAIKGRYLAAADASTYHQHIAQYLAGRGIEYGHALSELAWHLRQAGSTDELYALVEKPEFQRKKLSARGAVHDLSADIRLAFDAAFAARDAARVAQFGFLHAGYSEGRFAKLDVIELGRRDPQAAQEEIQLLKGLGRFRLLLLLALVEAEAGQTARANELVARAAAMRGLKLPDGQAPFVADAVATLMKAGCEDAPALLRCGLSTDAAVRNAIGVMPQLDEHDRVPLLNGAIEWLRKEFENPSATAPTGAFGEVARAAAGARDDSTRHALIQSLTCIIEQVRTAVDVAVEHQDVQAGLLAIMGWLHSKLRGQVPSESGNEIRIILRASLGAAMAVNGLDQRGLELLERAVGECAGRTISSHCFGAVTRELRRLRSAPATRLLLRLVTQASSDKIDDLKAILEVLADDRGGEGLIESVDAVGNRLKPVPQGKRVPLLENLAIAYGNAGRKELARNAAKRLHLPFAELSLVALNPLISPGRKLQYVRDTVRLVALTGERGPEWTVPWISRLASWTTKVQPEKDRVEALKDLLLVIRRSGQAGCVPAVLRAALAIKDEALGAEALEATIEAAEALDAEARARLRQGALDRADQFAEPARLRVLVSWIATAGATEASDLDHIRTRIDGFVDAAHRAVALGHLGCACLRLRCVAEARQWWDRAAYADQEAESRAMLFAARTAAASRGGDTRSWEDTLASVGCPDPAYAVRIVEVAARSCRDPGRLEQLEGSVSRRRWHILDREQFVTMHLAIARAWGRLGDPERGGRLALRALSRQGKRDLGRPAFRDVALTGVLLSDAPAGRRLLLQLIPRFHDMAESQYDCAIDLAEAYEEVEDDAFARTAFSQLYWAILDHEYVSGWRPVELVAGLAACLARRGQPDLAMDLLRRSPPPSGELRNEMLAPAAPTVAWARIGVAHAEIHAATSRLGSLQEARAAWEKALASASGARSATGADSICGAELMIWKVAGRTDSATAARALDQAEQSAAFLARGAINTWRGVELIAHAKALHGDAREALATARQIRDDETRDELLAEMAGVLSDRSEEHAVACWREIGAGSARLKAAWAVATRLTSPPAAPGAGARRRQSVLDSQQWTIPSHRSHLLLLGLGVTALGYWLAYLAWPAVRLGLAGPGRLPWIAGLAAAALVAATAASRSLRGYSDMNNPLLRWGVSLLYVAFLPISTAFWAANKRKATRTAWRARLAWVGGACRPRPAKVEPAVDQPTTEGLGGHGRLLGATLHESESFDVLLAAWIGSRGPSASDSATLARVPELELPREMPAKLAERYREHDEVVRSMSKWHGFTERVSRLASRIGLLLSGGILLVPLAMWGSIRMERRARRAKKLFARGTAAANKGQFGRAVPLLKRATELEPDVSSYLHNYAFALDGSGDRGTAMEIHRRAAEAGQGSDEEPQLWYGLGHSLFQAGRYHEALAAFEHVIAIAKPGTEEHEESVKGKGYCETNLGLKRSRAQ